MITKSILTWIITEHVSLSAIIIMKYVELDVQEDDADADVAMVRNSGRMASQWWGFVLDREIGSQRESLGSKEHCAIPLMSMPTVT